MTAVRCSATTAAGARCRRVAVRDGVCAQHATAAAPDPLVRDRVAGLLAAGNHLAVALDAAGLAPDTFDDWLARDASFRSAVEKAAAEGEARNVAIIANAASTNWQAAAWLLERGHPARWARPSQRPDAVAAQAPVPGRDEFTDLDELAARRRASR